MQSHSGYWALRFNICVLSGHNSAHNRGEAFKVNSYRLSTLTEKFRKRREDQPSTILHKTLILVLFFSCIHKHSPRDEAIRFTIQQRRGTTYQGLCPRMLFLKFPLTPNFMIFSKENNSAFSKVFWAIASSVSSFGPLSLYFQWHILSWWLCGFHWIVPACSTLGAYSY